MKSYAENNLKIRMAKEDDVPVILKFILELAEYEGVKDQIRSTEVGLKNILFAEHGAEALIAELDGEPIGFAIWAYSFSTFTGKPTLYIDDIFVQERWRGKGIGSRIFSHIAGIACEKDCGRMDWYCMETNVSGKEYYRKMGAEEIDWFRVYRLNRVQLEEMRESS
ncbi:MAG TPA: GNAT family N-acetyltransferase [Anaerovoracaceae bacterium]|nr:GNAT family N-acetyltransferase [Anaerovoracaceae bacterium]